MYMGSTDKERNTHTAIIMHSADGRGRRSGAEVGVQPTHVNGHHRVLGQVEQVERGVRVQVEHVKALAGLSQRAELVDQLKHIVW